MEQKSRELDMHSACPGWRFLHNYELKKCQKQLSGNANARPDFSDGIGKNMELDRGYLIALEGIDGTGKTTQGTLLGDYLEQCGLPVVRLREPTQGPWGQKIRKILTEGRGGITPDEELQWFLNDRKEDVEQNIRPALDANKVVVIDRYYYSTAAYQGALGFDPQKICADNEAFAPRPDRVLIFSGSLETSFERIAQGRDGFSSFEKKEYLKKVHAIFDSFEGPHIRRIDSDGSVDAVHRQVAAVADDLLGIRRAR